MPLLMHYFTTYAMKAVGLHTPCTHMLLSTYPNIQMFVNTASFVWQMPGQVDFPKGLKYSLKQKHRYSHFNPYSFFPAFLLLFLLLIFSSWNSPKLQLVDTSQTATTSCIILQTRILWWPEIKCLPSYEGESTFCSGMTDRYCSSHLPYQWEECPSMFCGLQ